MAWLESQLGPPFRTRLGARGRLIDSYEDEDRRGWIYDAALASIAFTALGRQRQARELLAGLEHLQRPDGSLAAAYHPDKGVALVEERYVGAIAWVVMAANYYQWHTGRPEGRSLALRALGFIEGFRSARPELQGAVSMGPDAPDVYSMEHNADSHAAFYWRGRLEGDRRYLAVAGDLRKFMLDRMWAGSYFRVGLREGELYLDCQTWTALTLGPGDPERARLEQAVAFAEARLRRDDGRMDGVSGIVGFSESLSVTKVWSEGTEGMVAALHSLGHHRRARLYHGHTARYQAASGGIPYTTESTGGWTPRPSVAGTGWFLLNELVPPRNPFRPGG